MTDLERELDRIYGLPPGDFTAARNELAKRLRKEGERDAAAEVAALRRPPVTAWALNQLARRAADDVAAAAGAGADLVQAQAATLGGGGDVDAFEAAQQRHRNAVRRLMQTAGGLLEEAGHRASDQTLERIASSLRAATTDDEGRRLLERGRFEDDFEGEGLFALAALASARPPARAAPARKPPAAARRTGAQAESRAPSQAGDRERRREELRRARERVREAQAAERAARRAADRAEDEAERARRQVDEARLEAERAERDSDDARRAADDARAALEAARAELEALDGRS